MALDYRGSLPVSAFQIGLSATLPGIAAKIAGLQSLIPKLAAGIDADISFSANFPPNLPAISASAFASFDPTSIYAMLDPKNWKVGLGASVALDVNLDLPPIEIALALVAEIVARLEIGINSGGLVGWTYNGPAAEFGESMERATRVGAGGVGWNDNISGLVIACEDQAAWESFGEGFNTGPDRPGLALLGSLGGAQWVTGIDAPFELLEAFRLELEGSKLALKTQLNIALGIDVPLPGELIDLGAGIDIDFALEGLVEFNADLQAQIDLLLGQIDILLELQGDINFALSAGGLSIWSYSGQLSALGTELRGAMSGGVPSGSGASAPIGGVAIACASPESWGAFGNLVAA